MSLHERTATFRSPGHHRQGSSDRSEETGKQSLARSSSGAMGGGSEGRELHERYSTARLVAGSSDPVSSLYLRPKCKSGETLLRMAPAAVLLTDTS